MIFHIDFKSGRINFYKQRKQPAKYKHTCIAPSRNQQEIVQKTPQNYQTDTSIESVDRWNKISERENNIENWI